MKLNKLLIGLAVLSMIMPALFVLSDDVSALTYGNFTYTIDGYGYANITGYIGTPGNLTIPSTIAGNKVSGLAADLFLNNAGLTGITFSYTGKGANFGDFALYGCTNLQYVCIDSASVGFGLRMFFSDTSLVNLTFAGVLNDSNVAWASSNYNFYNVPANFRVHAVVGSNFPAPGNTWTIGSETVTMGARVGAPIVIVPPHIISSPITNIGFGQQYGYFLQADQAGTNWTMNTNATWLSLTNYPAIIGLSPVPSSYGQNYSYWVDVHFHNENGIAEQNYTVNVTGKQGSTDDVAWLSMTPQMSLLVFLIGAGCIFILVTYMTLRKRQHG